MIGDNGTVALCHRRQISFSLRRVGGWENAGSVGGFGRSSIVSWNKGMAGRLRKFIESFSEDFTVMITLTYPREFPGTGSAVKGHLRAFTERLRRTGWLEHGSFVWFLEFQERGAPHFHLLATRRLEKDWIAYNWAEITNGNPKACSRTERIRKPDSAGAYAIKYAIKSEQKAIPTGFEAVGRMWGKIIAKIYRANFSGRSRGVPVAAYTSGMTPREIGKFFKKDFPNARIVENLSGFVIYGSAKLIEKVHKCVKNAFVDAKPTAGARESSPLRMLDALHVPLAMPEWEAAR
jgi:hypothetical protein